METVSSPRDLLEHSGELLRLDEAGQLREFADHTSGPTSAVSRSTPLTIKTPQIYH